MALGPHLSPEELAGYLDSHAAPADRRRIIGHLATCDTCFRELLEILRLVKGRPEEPGTRP